MSFGIRNTTQYRLEEVIPRGQKIQKKEFEELEAVLKTVPTQAAIEPEIDTTRTRLPTRGRQKDDTR
jgi:hypothetical protein